MTTRPPESLAAVDLGSNSFHVVVARVVDGEPVVIDRLREQVQLASGLDDEGRIAPSVWERALSSLERFGQRIRDFPSVSVRAVGTSALRNVHAAHTLLESAESALGYPVEIISGNEEARLVYLGVSHALADEPTRRLVVDIGGGSTECILGERFDPVLMDSLEMGCVSYSRQFFPGGKITNRSFEEAVVAARLELRSVRRRFQTRPWASSLGSSGTIRTIGTILRENDWSPRGVTAPGLDRLRDWIIDRGHVDALEIAGLGSDRRTVFPGGVAILVGVFEALGISHMDIASGSLREGVLYDLLGRIGHDDARDRTIATFQQRYHVDEEQAARVEKTALGFIEQVRSKWKLDPEEATRYLSWAARLHEIGLALSYGGHHRHGAYLVENSDMPGFSRNDQQLLATLIRTHRRKLKGGSFRELPSRERTLAKRLATILRLAVRLHRERSAEPLPVVRLSVRAKNRVVLQLPVGWLDEHPLTHADLQAEAQRLTGIDLSLTVEG